MSYQKRVIICNGPPGNGGDELIRELKIASVGYHHIFEYIVEEARLDNTNLTKINILDFYDSQPEKMELYRLKAIQKINHEINRSGGVHIIRTPVHFEWTGNRYQG